MAAGGLATGEPGRGATIPVPRLRGATAEPCVEEGIRSGWPTRRRERGRVEVKERDAQAREGRERN
jgi:hypothetical protein